MTYIIMARDECNTEVRVGSDTFANADSACDQLDAAKEDHPEYRSFWVEVLKNKAYYLDQYDDREGDEYDQRDLF